MLVVSFEGSSFERVDGLLRDRLGRKLPLGGTSGGQGKLAMYLPTNAPRKLLEAIREVMTPELRSAFRAASYRTPSKVVVLHGIPGWVGR